MENKKAYFVTSDLEEVYELSAKNRNRLEKKFPEWNQLNSSDNYEELNLVYDFFKKYGKLVAAPIFTNVFVGLTTE